MTTNYDTGRDDNKLDEPGYGQPISKKGKRRVTIGGEDERQRLGSFSKPIIGAYKSPSMTASDSMSADEEELLNAETITMEAGQDLSLPINPEAIVLIAKNFMSRRIDLAFTRTDVSVCVCVCMTITSHFVFGL